MKNRIFASVQTATANPVNVLLTDARILLDYGWSARRVLGSMKDMTAEYAAGYCTAGDVAHAERVLTRLAALSTETAAL